MDVKPISVPGSEYRLEEIIRTVGLLTRQFVRDAKFERLP